MTLSCGRRRRFRLDSTFHSAGWRPLRREWTPPAIASAAARAAPHKLSHPLASPFSPVRSSADALVVFFRPASRQRDGLGVRLGRLHGPFACPRVVYRRGDRLDVAPFETRSDHIVVPRSGAFVQACVAFVNSRALTFGSALDDDVRRPHPVGASGARWREPSP